jgi:hypothetical protein
MAYAQGAKFAEKEVPTDIEEKRSKIHQRAERKKEEGEKPHKVNTSALKKKIQTQLDGLDLLEKLVNDLVRSGLGTLNAKSARQIEEQAKQLGNAYLPGSQNALHAPPVRQKPTRSRCWRTRVLRPSHPSLTFTQKRPPNAKPDTKNR